MIQKHNSNDMKLKLFFVLLSLIFCGCSEEIYCPQNFYKVKKIVKKENNVFFIYAEKNDEGVSKVQNYPLYKSNSQLE